MNSPVGEIIVGEEVAELLKIKPVGWWNPCFGTQYLTPYLLFYLSPINWVLCIETIVRNNFYGVTRRLNHIAVNLVCAFLRC